MTRPPRRTTWAMRQRQGRRSDGSQGMGVQDPSQRRPGGNLERASRRHPSTLAPGEPRPRRGRRWALMTVIVATVGALTALFGFGLTRDPSAIRSALVHRRAPQFGLRTLD